MKLNKRLLHQQRKRLDSQVNTGIDWSILIRPRKGWIKAVRESLGMSTQQLASRMGLKNAASVFRMEEREVDGAITLEALERAAKAMRCRVVYAIVPNDGSFEKALENQAIEAAAKQMKSVTHSMRLESQGVDNAKTALQVSELAEELKEKLDSRIWSE
jgi:predicted DNA-binding mobile mystery protein A